LLSLWIDPYLPRSTNRRRALAVFYYNIEFDGLSINSKTGDSKSFWRRCWGKSINFNFSLRINFILFVVVFHYLKKIICLVALAFVFAF